MRQNIILAFDGSSEELDALLCAEKLPAWRAERLWLMAIIPRPVQACLYEPDFFHPSISMAAHEDIQQRLNRGRDHLTKRGFDLKAEIVYRDAKNMVTQALRALNPDLLVAVRSAYPQKSWPWRQGPTPLFLVDVSPCAVLIL